jgi:hypothetical protein
LLAASTVDARYLLIAWFARSATDAVDTRVVYGQLIFWSRSNPEPLTMNDEFAQRVIAIIRPPVARQVEKLKPLPGFHHLSLPEPGEMDVTRWGLKWSADG